MKRQSDDGGVGLPGLGLAQTQIKKKVLDFRIDGERKSAAVNSRLGEKSACEEEVVAWKGVSVLAYVPLIFKPLDPVSSLGAVFGLWIELLVFQEKHEGGAGYRSMLGDHIDFFAA